MIDERESSTAAMADGCARTTGGIGAVAAMPGGDVMKLVAGLAWSSAACIPVWLPLVDHRPYGKGHGAFQDTSGGSGSFDALRLFVNGLFGSIARYCVRIDHVEGVPDGLARVITTTQVLRYGNPVVAQR
ncbi:thiamine pyrophosphate-binding protein [Nocardia donostiensis]|uniref:Thiamine pyrophosphate enzyme N-terminal TPP-binding domain-containing protein n=1 Tax=Nocardia donostiensis TaxID=1538463 RepID=A0A1W0AUC0_9NOCA|nr:thiamine pyrophosphate-binding protein [Nocardia donostiensis]ONM48171.1 hypothetical protein B0T46_14405 [Nocardia donostiensis]OQS13837.1 hypothetical protein B0T36_16975 [Nocardia donostiensis]OQS17563.1 hypothetical protein B0T44_24285 [Nocardia donostiensis]